MREQGLEGIIGKRKDIYQPGKRSGAWIKYRVNRGQEFVIGGYFPGPHGFDSLIVGYYDGGKLMYVARTRNGVVPASRRQVFSKLKHLATVSCPFAIRGFVVAPLSFLDGHVLLQAAGSPRERNACTTSGIPPRAVKVSSSGWGSTSNSNGDSVGEGFCIRRIALTITTVNASTGFNVASNTCGTSIGAGASCTIGVTFSPTATGPVNGTLTFTDSAVTSPQGVTLSGTGQ